MRYHVYSPLLGGYIAMGFKTSAEAQDWINTYRAHDTMEARQCRIVQVAFTPRPGDTDTA